MYKSLDITCWVLFAFGVCLAGVSRYSSHAFSPHSFSAHVPYRLGPLPSTSTIRNLFFASSEVPKDSPASHIATIRTSNFAGTMGGEGGNLEVHFNKNGDITGDSRLVAVTGESGVGKSLLVSKVVDLVTGGKASANLVQNPTSGASASVEIILKLVDLDHIQMVRQLLDSLNVDPEPILGKNADTIPLNLSLKRSLSAGNNGRLKSTAYLNEQQVPLKVLKAVGTPLLSQFPVLV